MRRILLFLSLLLAASVGAPAAAAPPAKPPIVLAAASLQESLTAAAAAWAKQGHAAPTISFAGSSELARQIEAGAPADLFISADEDWMDAVEKHGDVAAGTRDTFLGNRLVLIAPKTRTAPAPMRPSSALTNTLTAGPLAMADTGSVPAGKYGKAALEHMRLWAAVQPHVVEAENVRAALALVERGAAPLGVVYATDARASVKVKIVGVFPESSHPPIRYPVARLKAATSPDAEGFRRFLVSARGKAIFKKYGFSAL
ncbi:molybdate ABC transporter substrate-binding protein [Sphingomonas koreensis]|nr:molybdate ABC transporter substrate-binding protein [Sphingomonas koreensis]